MPKVKPDAPVSTLTFEGLASELVTLAFTFASDSALIGELVKRGVLVEQANEFGRPFRLFAVGEPVGSVGTP